MADQGRSEPLNQSHGPGLRIRALEPGLVAGTAFREIGRYRPIHNAQHLAHDRRVAGKQEAQARGNRGNGTLSTHWRTGRFGNTSSTNNAALSAIRLTPQLGQNPRRLQLKARGRPGQFFLVAVVTAHTQKAMLQPTPHLR